MFKLTEILHKNWILLVIILLLLVGYAFFAQEKLPKLNYPTAVAYSYGSERGIAQGKLIEFNKHYIVLQSDENVRIWIPKDKLLFVGQIHEPKSVKSKPSKKELLSQLEPAEQVSDSEAMAMLEPLPLESPKSESKPNVNSLLEPVDNKNDKH